LLLRLLLHQQNEPVRVARRARVMRSLTGQCLAPTDNHLPSGKSNLQSTKARQLRLMHDDKVKLATVVTRVAVLIAMTEMIGVRAMIATIEMIAVREMIAMTVMIGAFSAISTTKMAATAIAIVDDVVDQVVLEIHATKVHKVMIATK
jgi:hypothetical protein